MNNEEFQESDVKTIKEGIYKNGMYVEKIYDVHVLYEDYYIDEECEVISFKRKKPIKKKSRIIGGDNNGNGYKAVDLCINGKVETKYNHILGAAKCIPNYDPKYSHVNHIDGNRLNNHVTNLEWCTPKYNNIDKVNRKKYGRIIPLPLEVEEIQVTCKYKGSEKNVR